MPKTADTSWGRVANWYNELLNDEDSYQSKVVLPGLRGLMEADGKLIKKDKIIDVACGQGFFARSYIEAGAGEVVGADISPELISLAKEGIGATKNLSFCVAAANNLKFAKSNYFTKATIVLALDNIRELHETLSEAARVLLPGGRLYIVINHPAFRIIGNSSWAYDNRAHIQYRRLDSYLSESSKKVVMNPGAKNSELTITFHRPMSTYVNELTKAGMSVVGMEEWVSHKKSDKGPRSKAEDKARLEFPLFLALVAQKKA